MHLVVIAMGFTAGLAAFAAWLIAMLHQDHMHRVALVAASREHSRSHRRAAVAARYTPEREPRLPVVRAGSFCRVPGNYGYSKGGAVLVCADHGSARPRWRKAPPTRLAA